MSTNHMSFKMNIGLYFFFSTLLIVLLISSTYYYFAKEELYSEVVDSLKSTVGLGVNTLDTDAFKRLVEILSNDNNFSNKLHSRNKQSEELVENSKDFRVISDQLNKIRNTKQGLIIYIYTLIPGKDRNSARFVVDADLLSDLKKTKISGNNDFSSFGKVYDISSQPVTQKALLEKINIIDTHFVYDKEYDVNSIMGFAPIYDKKTNEFLGVLGADISDGNILLFLNKIFYTSLLETFAAILIVVIMSIFLAGSVSKPIIIISSVVKRFSNKDFNARVQYNTKISEIADLIESYNSMVDEIRKNHDHLVSLNSSYERFVPVEFLSYMSKDNIMQVKLGDQIQKDMAILFSDIRSFTAMSEAMTPKQTFDFLNSYLQQVGPIIRKHSGFIDNYLGDGIMALFPKTPDDAVRAAIEIRHKLLSYNKNRIDQGLVEINTGIGIHIGTLMLGTIGEEKRMQGTVISDAVNLASRLEGLTKTLGVSTLISKELFSRLEEPEKYHYRFLGNSSIKGKSESVAIFEIYDGDSNEVVAQKNVIKLDFEKGVYHFATEEYHLAQAIFENILSRYPDDKISSIYLQKCKDIRMQG